MPEQWRKIEEVFQAALGLEPGERTSYVAEACAHDHGLKVEIEQLLAQYDNAGRAAAEPFEGEAGQRDEVTASGGKRDPVLGQVLGAYRIEREVGRGGMGS